MKPLGTDVSISDAEAVTGTGLQRAVYDEIESAETAFKALPSLTPSPTFQGTLAAWVQAIQPIRLNILRSWARTANAHAKALSGRTLSTPVATTSYTVLAADDIVLVDGNTAGGNVAITFPLAASFPSRVVEVKNVVMGGFSSTPTRAGSDTIDGGTTAAIAGNYAFQRYISDGVSAWYSI